MSKISMKLTKNTWQGELLVSGLPPCLTEVLMRVIECCSKDERGLEMPKLVAEAFIFDLGAFVDKEIFAEGERPVLTFDDKPYRVSFKQIVREPCRIVVEPYNESPCQ